MSSDCPRFRPVSTTWLSRLPMLWMTWFTNSRYPPSVRLMSRMNVDATEASSVLKSIVMLWQKRRDLRWRRITLERFRKSTRSCKKKVRNGRGVKRERTLRGVEARMMIAITPYLLRTSWKRLGSVKIDIHRRWSSKLIVSAPPSRRRRSRASAIRVAAKSARAISLLESKTRTTRANSLPMHCVLPRRKRKWWVPMLSQKALVRMIEWTLTLTETAQLVHHARQVAKLMQPLLLAHFKKRMMSVRENKERRRINLVMIMVKKQAKAKALTS